MKSNNLPKLSGYLPKQEPEIFPSPGCCIYCGETENLTDEHIIPFALGGKLVLENSSCRSCAEITSKYELTCLRTMYGPLRLLYDLPTRRPKKRPKSLPLKVKYSPEEDEWQKVMVAQDQYPFLVAFPYFEAPGIFSGEPPSKSKGAKTNRLWIRGGSPYYSFDELLPKITSDLQAYSIFPESKSDIPAFCKMISKIAHSYAIAKLGIEGFLPLLNPIIISDQLDHCMHYIGSLNSDEPPRDMLHELGFVDFRNINAIFVRIRLLSKLGTPTYVIAVGTKK